MADPEAYEVYAIRYCNRAGRDAKETFLTTAWSDPSHDFTADCSYYVWLVRNENRTVLVDTGFGRDELARRQQHAGGWWRPDYALSPAEGLARLGIDAAGITDVIISHLHYDHAGTTDDFPAATFHLQEAEMRYATGRHMRRPGLRSAYAIEDVVGMIRRLYRGRVHFVDGDVELAPGISLHLVGGHTPGIQAVRVLTRRGWVVLASDATHFYANVEGRTPYPIVFNVGDMLDGFDRLNELASTPSHIIPGHDPLVMDWYPPPSTALQGVTVRLDQEERRTL